VKDEIADFLDVKPIAVEIKELDKTPETVEEDYEHSRQSLYAVIGQGLKAIEEISDIARVSEQARAYEVMSTLMNTVVNANEKLLDLSKKKRDLDGPEKPDTEVTNNNLFVGSTAELQKLLKDVKDGE
jgi:hypothetical protein